MLRVMMRKMTGQLFKEVNHDKTGEDDQLNLEVDSNAM